MRRNNRKPWGLYVHIPFCRSKCPYCAFYSIASGSLIPRWLKALKDETALWAAAFGETPPVFDSIHLGGGTPSILDCRDLKAILGNIKLFFDVAEDCEIAIETNPLDITPEKAGILRHLGFTRAVVGIQSFNDRILSFLGRGHRGEDGARALNDLRAAGFDNIGMDLIYGAAGGGLEEWLKDLGCALAISPEHISCYCLSIEQGSVFKKMADLGEIPALAEEQERELFLEASRLLCGRGYIHYEVSNFARSEGNFSRHNQKYWRRGPYLGLGPSAHSFDGEKRWWNRRSIRAYCDALERGLLPVEESEELTQEQAALERIAMGLRIREGFGLDEETAPFINRENLEMIEAGGFVRVREGVVTPTTQGFLVADRLPLEIMT